MIGIAFSAAKTAMTSQNVSGTAIVTWPYGVARPQLARLRVGRSGRVSLIGFLVGGDGTVVDTVVLNSSGSRIANRTAALALSRCEFQRPAIVDKAVDPRVSITYAWHPNDDPDMLRASRSAAIAASRGNVSARYHLSLLLFSLAKADADREKAFIVLRSAAELGHRHAQFDFARRHERGDGVETNLDEALRWYQKSAEQGDPLAKQRVTLGLLLS